MDIKELDKLKTTILRNDRAFDALRTIKIETNYIKNADGSVLIEFGNTKIVCVASIEEKIPRWLQESPERKGWITAEYSMTPYAGGDRKQREATSGKVCGRTHEIQRLIGRSLRAAVDLEKLGERTIWIDCDVLQADGGTRTASITGGYIALCLALQKLIKNKKLKKSPLINQISAISVGIYNNEFLLDLNYNEDVAVDVDFNVVMTEKKQFVEIQGTAENGSYSREQLNEMLKLAEKGCLELQEIQKNIISKLEE